MKIFLFKANIKNEHRKLNFHIFKLLNWRIIIFTLLALLNAANTAFAQMQAPSVEIEKKIIEGEQRAAQARMNFRENALTTNYNIVYDQCYWNIDPAVKFISGHINTYFIPNSIISSIILDMADSLVADSVLYQNQSIAFSHSGNMLTINFPYALNPGTKYNTDIYYHGIPPSDTSGFGSFSHKKHGPDSTYTIWTLSEPYGASEWWPCKNSLNDKIDSIDMYVKTPSQYQDASNGLLVSSIVSAGFTTYHWKHRYPIATYLVAINVTSFSICSDKAVFQGDTLQILNYFWKEDSASDRGAVQSMIPGMLLYDSLFEIYPFHKEKYGHAQFGWGGGMEHQTMTYAGNFSFELLVHECAHQWFGDKVTCGSWEDIFLNEGFAVYLTDLCYEYLQNGYWWPAWKDWNLKSITSKPDGSIWVNDTSSVHRIFDPRLTYAKGGYFLHQLRYQVGDSGFFAGVRNYLDDPLLSYNFARWTDLKSHIETASGKNLTTYFNQWFFGEGFPNYQLNWSQDASNLITLTVNQSASKPSSVPFFDLDIPVEFKNSSKDTIVRLTNTSSGQTYSIQLPFRADSTKFDPERWLITASNTVTGISSVPALSYDVNIFPNPVLSEVSIHTNDNLPHIKSVELMNALGEIIYEKIYSNRLNHILLECSAFAPSVYFLKIITDEGELNKKVSLIR